MAMAERRTEHRYECESCGRAARGARSLCPDCGGKARAVVVHTVVGEVWWTDEAPTAVVNSMFRNLSRGLSGQDITAALRSEMNESQHIHIEGDGHNIQIARNNARQKMAVTNAHMWQADLDALLVNLQALVGHIEPEQAEELEEHVILIQEAAKLDAPDRLRGRLIKTKHLLGELTVGAAGNGVYEAAKVGFAAVLGHFV